MQIYCQRWLLRVIVITFQNFRTVSQNLRDGHVYVTYGAWASWFFLLFFSKIVSRHFYPTVIVMFFYYYYLLSSSFIRVFSGRPERRDRACARETSTVSEWRDPVGSNAGTCCVVNLSISQCSAEVDILAASGDWYGQIHAVVVRPNDGPPSPVSDPGRIFGHY